MAPVSVSLEERIKQLLEFEAEHGHMFVPRADKRLGSWVDNTRTKKKKGKLDEDTIAKLDEVGFIWTTPKGPAKDELIEWGKHYRWLVSFHKSKGHLNVPAKIAGKAVPTAAWCDEQRQLHMDRKLDHDKWAKLSKLGFDFYGSSADNEIVESASKRQRTDSNAEKIELEKKIQVLEEENQSLKKQVLEIETKLKHRDI